MVAVGELVIPAGYVEYSFVHQQNDTLRPGVCTLGFHTVAGADLLIIGDGWRDHVMPQINNSWTYVQARASVQAGLIFQQDYTTVGGGGGAGLVPNTAYLVRKIVALPGRGHHGRLYLPGCDEPSVDADGRVDPAKVTGLQDAMDAFAELMSTDSIEMSLLHTLPAPPRVVLAPDIVDGFTVQNRVATQRRRLRK